MVALAVMVPLVAMVVGCITRIHLPSWSTAPSRAIALALAAMAVAVAMVDGAVMAAMAVPVYISLLGFTPPAALADWAGLGVMVA